MLAGRRSGLALEGHEVDGGGDDGEPRHVSGDARVGDGCGPAQHVEGRHRTLIDAEPRARISLRIEIDDENALADGGERGAEIDGGRGLTHAAFLVGEGKDAGAARGEGVHHVPAFAVARGRNLVTSTIWESSAVRLG